MNNLDDFVIENGLLIKYTGGDQRVTIPDGVTSIGKMAFSNCSCLKSIYIPDGVLNIGEMAFYKCSNLGSIYIPDSVTNIEKLAFSNCHSLESVHISCAITSIGRAVFSECSNLTSVNIPDGVTGIGEYAFSECINLASVRIPDSVTSIGKGAFSKCRNLMGLHIPDAVTSIGQWAFSDCEKLDLSDAKAYPKLKEVLWEYKPFKFSYFCYADDNALSGDIIDFCKKNKKDLLDFIVKKDSVKGMYRFLALANRYTIQTLDDYIEKCNGNEELEIIIEEFKRERFSDTALKNAPPTYVTLDCVLPDLRNVRGKGVLITQNSKERHADLEYILKSYGCSIETDLSQNVDYIIVSSARLRVAKKENQVFYTEATRMQNDYTKAMFVLADAVIEQHNDIELNGFDYETSEERLDRAVILFESNVKIVEDLMDNAKNYSSVPFSLGAVRGVRRENWDIAGAEMFLKRATQLMLDQGLGYDRHKDKFKDSVNELSHELYMAFDKLVSVQNKTEVYFSFDGRAWLRFAIAIAVLCKVFLTTKCNAEVSFCRDKWEYRGEYREAERVTFALSNTYTAGNVYLERIF